MGREQFALQDIDLCVRAGERVGVIGESGSGKSTLVRCLLGLEVPERGELKIAGMNVNPTRREQTVEQRRLVQAVFQDPVSSLNPRLPIETIIAEPLRLLPKYPGPDELRDRVNRALTSVGLTGVSLQARPHEFSGGQRQRLAIARALVIEPQLLVLDEAVSALDAATRNEILLLLQELFRSRGLGFLFVTHDLSVVRAITDRLIVLRQGKVVDEVPTARLLTSPEHPYTRELVEATPSLIRRQSLDSGSHDAQ
jgi:peptide/nickel transport system ATP-binding protein